MVRLACGHPLSINPKANDVCVTFVFTAMNVRTGGSVLIAILLHAAINGAVEFFIGLFEGADRVRMYWLMAAVCTVIAVAAVVLNPDRWRRAPARANNAA